MTDNSIPEWEVINPDHTPFEDDEDDEDDDDEDYDDYEDDGEDDDDDYDYSLIVEL
jgi:hypothetical protein